MTNQDFRVKNGLQVGVGGTVFTADIGGKVGINSTSPTATLDIQGTVKSSGTITAPTFAGTATTANNLSNAANITTGIINPSRLSGNYNINITGSVSGDTTSISTASVSNNLNVGSGNTGVFATAGGNLNVSGITTLGVTSTTNLTSQQLNVSGVSTFTGAVTGTISTATKLENARTFEITGDIIASPISFDGTGNVSLAATIQPNSVALGSDTTGDYVQSISGTSNQITVTGGTGEGSTPTLSIPNQFTAPQDATVTRDLQVNRNLNVNGNITIGGTTAFINVQQLQVADPDLVLGFRTDGSGNDVSNDNTANHGGIAIASTEGNPLVQLFIAGIETTPATYKKIMWFKAGQFSGLGTDAWLTNYAVGIGSTQFPTETRLAAGAVQITERDLTVVRNINASGVVTAASFSGNASSATYATSAGVATYASTSGVATALQNSRTFEITGDVVASPVIFDGTGNVSLAATIQPNSVALGNDTTGNYVASITNGSYITGADGGSESAALIIGVAATSTNTVNQVVARDASGNFSAGTITANLTGTASLATYATNAGTSTSVIGGIASVTQLSVSGVSTFSSNIIQTSGSVGLGTTNPLQRFQIGTANTLGINTTGTVFVVTSNADVGIGTTNPRSKLDVRGAINVGGAVSITAERDSGNNDVIYFNPLNESRVSIGINTTLNWSSLSGIPDVAFVADKTIFGYPKIAIANPTQSSPFYKLRAAYSNVSAPYGYVRQDIDDGSYAIALDNAATAFSVGDRTSLDSTRASNFSAANEAFVVILNGSTSLFHNKSKKFETSGVGVTVTGTTSTDQLIVSGVSTFTNGPVLIGSGTSTGTASQRLQVTGGAYVSGNLGIGTTNPAYKLDVIGRVRATNDIDLDSTTGALNLTGRPNYTIGGNYPIVDISHPAGGSLYALYGWEDTGNDRVYQQLRNSTDYFTALSSDSEFIIGLSGGLLDGSAYSFKIDIDAETSLYFNNSEKLTTTQSGVSVTGLTSTTTLNVGTGGTIITTTASGLVGIGTTNPISKLNVIGNTYLDGGLDITGDITSVGSINVSDTKTLSFVGGSSVFSNPQITIAALNSSANLYELYAYDQTSGTDYVFEIIKTATDRQFILGNNREFVVAGGSPSGYPADSSQYAFKVKIGAETSLYHNQSEKLTTTGYGVTVTGGLSVSGVTTTGNLNVGTGGTVITTTAAGLVGIGTTNPTSKLHVIGDARVGIDTSQGVILTSSNGTKYRLIVSDAGALSTVLVT